MKDKKIAIIGCGNLGLSILTGLMDNPAITNSNLTATKRNIGSIKHLESEGVHITTDNALAIQQSEIIIVALKPYNILENLEILKSHFKTDQHMLVSLATAIEISDIRKVIPTPIPIYRAMPNTAADVKMSMTCIATYSNDEQATQDILNCFNSIGSTIIIEEDLMDSATVLGACGIAFALRFIRGMIQGGIEIGFDAKTANNIVTHTIKGAAELLIQRKEHPEYEIDKVTTPKGCTIAGLNEMEHHGFSSALIKGISTSYKKIDTD